MFKASLAICQVCGQPKLREIQSKNKGRKKERIKLHLYRAGNAKLLGQMGNLSKSWFS